MVWRNEACPWGVISMSKGDEDNRHSHMVLVLHYIHNTHPHQKRTHPLRTYHLTPWSPPAPSCCCAPGAGKSWNRCWLLYMSKMQSISFLILGDSSRAKTKTEEKASYSLLWKVMGKSKECLHVYYEFCPLFPVTNFPHLLAFLRQMLVLVHQLEGRLLLLQLVH